MGRNVVEEENVNSKLSKRLVRVDDLVAEVDVYLTDGKEGWPPYLSLDDAYKLDDVREALSVGDLKRASELASHIYRLTPV